MKIKEKLIAFTFILIIFLQAVLSMRNKSATFDETSHLPAGYSYLKTGDFRVTTGHPPLIEQICALPLLFMNPDFPEEAWKTGNEWHYGKIFLYDNKVSADKMLFVGRLPVVILSCILGYFVFLWSSQLFGTKAGLFSLFLYAFCPNIIAHSSLVTTDLGAALFTFLALYTFWSFLKKPNWLNSIFWGISMGLALVAKFSSILLFPIYLIIGLMFYFKEGRRKLPVFMLIGAILISIWIIMADYEFSFIGSYFDGFKEMLKYSSAFSTFLIGKYGTKGWPHYYLVAFFLKTPIPYIILILSGLWMCRKHKDIYFIYVTVAFFFLFFSLSKRQLGLRYILPIYPLLFICAGNVINSVFKKRKLLIPFFVLSGWIVFSQIKIFPDYLSYFNEFARGPNNGWKYLTDSNIDWGQDLKGLGEFLEKEKINNVILSYFGSTPPGYYVPRFQNLLSMPFLDPRGAGINPINPDKEYLVVSATNLIGVYFNNHTMFDWLWNTKPIKKIGYSIFVYDITTDAETHLKLGQIYEQYGDKILAQREYARAQIIYNNMK